MTKAFRRLFGMSAKPGSAFSAYFTEYSSREKKKIMRDAVRMANEEQLATIEAAQHKTR